MKVTLDTVEGSHAEAYGTQQRRYIRTGFIEDITATDSADEILHFALTAPGLPAQGSPHPRYPYSFLTRREVSGLEGRSARLRLIYEPFFGVVDTAYLITTSSSMEVYETNFYPGTRIPWWVGWARNSLTTPFNLLTIPKDLARVRVKKIIARVEVQRMNAGTVTETEQADFMNNTPGYVNSNPWMGRGRAAWLITSASMMASKFGGFRSMRMSAETAGPAPEDHRVATILFNSQTGKYHYDPRITIAISDAIAAEYTPFTELVPTPSEMGCSVYCPYPVADFPAIFGF